MLPEALVLAISGTTFFEAQNHIYARGTSRKNADYALFFPFRIVYSLALLGCLSLLFTSHFLFFTRAYADLLQFH